MCNKLNVIIILLFRLDLRRLPSVSSQAKRSSHFWTFIQLLVNADILCNSRVPIYYHKL